MSDAGEEEEGDEDDEDEEEEEEEGEEGAFTLSSTCNGTFTDRSILQPLRRPRSERPPPSLRRRVPRRRMAPMATTLKMTMLKKVRRRALKIQLRLLVLRLLRLRSREASSLRNPISLRLRMSRMRSKVETIWLALKAEF